MYAIRSYYGAVFDGGSNHEDRSWDGSSSITWDSDVEILPGPAPEILIDSAGALTISPPWVNVSLVGDIYVVDDSYNFV